MDSDQSPGGPTQAMQEQPRKSHRRKEKPKAGDFPAPWVSPSTTLPPSRSHKSVPPAPAAQTRSNRGTTPGRWKHLSRSAARAHPSTGVTWKVSQNAQLLPAQPGEAWLDTGTCPETTMWVGGLGVQGKIHFTPTLIFYQGHDR